MPLGRVPLRSLTALAAATLVVPLLAASPATAVPGTGSPVWINEIHYDNAGTDAGEAIEVAAVAGTDLTGWSIVLYNGSGGASYDTDALPAGPVADAGTGYGFVTLTYPANGIQNGGPDGIALVNGTTVVQFLSYEGSFAAVGGPANGQTSTDIGASQAGTEAIGSSLQLTGTGLAAGDFTWTSTTANTFGTVNTGQIFGTPPPPPAPCDTEATHLISAVQGSGAATPLAGATVTVEGVVTADRRSTGLGGFWLEEEGADRDADPLTSEGVFVFGSVPAGAGEGSVVQVTGTVSERFNQTQISATSVEDCETAGVLPAAAEVTFPVASTTYLEQFEGMVVRFPQDLVISEYFNYDRFGETVIGLPLDGLSRFHTPTAVVEPGAAAQALAAEYELRQITVDDGRGGDNRTPAYFPGTVDTPLAGTDLFRGGDTLTDVTGVLAFDFSIYRVHPTADATYTQVNPRPEAAPEVGGDVTVASFNVLNYFLTLDGGATRGTCGPTQDQDCRGADFAAEFDRQKTKIVEALTELDADVVGLMEMENTPGVEPAADLAAALNDRVGAGTYSYIDTGVIGTDAIRVGLLYKAGVVKPLESFQILDSSVDPRFIDTANRPALAQTFKTIDGDKRFTVAVNHLKSKGSDCDDLNDPDTGDGQGNCNLTRTAAAEALADWLASPNIGRGDPDRLIIGDLNSYDHEDPIDALVDAGYTDLIREYGGEHAYGYVFDGMVGYLDHALANETMLDQVTGAAEWHINADEPDILDYDMSFKAPAEEALFEPNEFRSSDHDAVLVGLDLTGHSRR